MRSAGFPIAHLSFVCLSHGGGSLAQVSQNHAEQVVESELVFQLRANHRRWIAEPCFGARFRARTAVIREQPRISSYNNKISRPVYRRNQPLLNWTSHKVDRDNASLLGTTRLQPQRVFWFSTSLLGTTRLQPQRVFWFSTSLLGTTLLHPQRATLTLPVIVDSQLTPSISRDDDAQGQDAPRDEDAPMPDAPSTHDIATPRRTIGRRCQKWCISAQPASSKRECTACSMSWTRFSHGEARLQQWGKPETNQHYVHAHCVNGGLGHDHELLPKASWR